MKIIKTYDMFNSRRYSDPWVCMVRSDGTLNFDDRVGAYTGRRRSGEAGSLYVFSPIDGQVYAYGRKDYRGNGTTKLYVQYLNGEFVPVSNTDLVQVLSSMQE